MSRQLLKELESDQNIYKYVEKSRWKDYSKKIYQAIWRNIDLVNFRSDYDICKGYGDAIKTHLPSFINFNLVNIFFNIPFLKNIKFAYSKYKYFKRKKPFLQNISINKYDYFKNDSFNPQRIFNIDGCKFSEKYIRSIILNKKYFNINHSKVFCEIGGGFGANIHTVVNRNKNLKKIICIDIPPVLYVQTVYLKKIYGDSVVDYNKVKNLDNFEFKNNDKLEILCIPPWFIQKIKNNSIEVLVNNNSFQEIDREVLKLLLKDIKPKLSKNFKFFFSFYFEKNLDNFLQFFQKILANNSFSYKVKKDFIFDYECKIYTN